MYDISVTKSAVLLTTDVNNKQEALTSVIFIVQVFFSTINNKKKLAPKNPSKFKLKCFLIKNSTFCKTFVVSHGQAYGEGDQNVKLGQSVTKTWSLGKYSGQINAVAVVGLTSGVRPDLL